MDLSVQDLIDQFGVRNIDKECTKEDILAFGNFCHPWKQVGFYLNLTEAQLSAIDEENQTVPLKRLGVLQKWKSRFAFRATYRVLVTALLKCEKTDEARKVCEILAQREGGVAPVTAAQLASSSRPTTVTSKLDLVIDAENRAPKHLGHIADSMYEWEGTIADELGLAPSEVAAITKQHPMQLKLQARAALLKWKETNGSAATYRNLIGVFERAGYQGYAETVRRIALSQTGTSGAVQVGVVSPTSQASQPKSSSSPSAEQATSRNAGDSGNNIDTAHFIVIRWNDDQGKKQKFRLVDQIKDKWRDIGRLARVAPNELDSLSAKPAAECCTVVLEKWMKAPPPDYPGTWEGLIELLEDVPLDNVVTELKEVLKRANIA